MKKTKRSKTSKSAFTVVVIGASAGGSRALKELLSTVKDLKNMAVIVAQHLDPSGKSLAIEALQVLKDLKVAALKEKPIKPGFIYSLPPHTLVSFKDGSVNLSMARTSEKKLAVIDALFTSAAKEYGEYTVGVVLSGNASDGGSGVKAINNAGGLTLAQTPESAENPSMPEHAIATGSVDYILKPKDIWKEVQSYASFITSTGTVQKTLVREESGADLIRICEILHEKTKHDFKHYKTSTLLRRIQRRMHVLHLAKLADYISFLEKHPEEIETLFAELLINVTSFFRDKESFEMLSQEALAPLFENRQANQKIRIWVAGCSTGEEAYSLAILLRELQEKYAEAPDIQIIATDIDPEALNVARRGVYPPSIADHVSPERLAKYFVRRSGKFHVTKELREACLFSIHNLITDPPFSQIDLISCRNVLIYLGSHLQAKLFPVFHYALRANGYLFLGTSESLTSHRELFKPISNKHRIAQRKPTAIKIPSLSTSVQSYLSHFQMAEKVSEADLSLIGQRIALDEMPFRYAIVNEDAQILSSSAGLSKYVQIVEGTFQNNIVRLANPSLRSPLRSAFVAAKKEKRKVTNDSCTMKVGDHSERTMIIVQPMPQLGDLSELYWVAFQNMGTIHNKTQSAPGTSSEDDLLLIEQLERELRSVRSELDKAVQDNEASNEELKSSNEELLSMNEELQSANEELETSKEEVQNFNDALQRSNSDLENLLASTQIATIFLNDEYRIRSFTPAIQSIYNIQESDVGRKLTDFTSLTKAMPKYPDVKTVTLQSPDEVEIAMPDGRIFLRRVLPYRTPDNVTDGIVATFIDITDLRQSEGRFSKLANSVPVISWTTDKNGNVEFFNSRWYEYTGQSPDEALGWAWQSAIHPEDIGSTAQVWSKALMDGNDYNVEYRLRRHDGQYRWHRATGVPFKNANKQIESWFGTCIDFHDQHTFQEKLAAEAKRTEQARDELREFFLQAPEPMVKFKGPEHKFTLVNKPYKELIGEDPTGKTVREVFSKEADGNFFDLLDDVYKTGKPYIATEVPFKRTTRSGGFDERCINIGYYPSRDVDGKIDGISAFVHDVTDQVEARLMIERAKNAVDNERANFQNLFKQTPEMVCILSGPEHKFVFVNEAHIQVLGFSAVGKTVREAQPESVEVHGILDDVYRTGKTAELHEIPVTVGKKLRYFNLTYAAARDVEGTINGIMILGTEVTEQVHARSELERTARLIETMPAPFFAMNKDWKVTYWNPASVEMTGFSKDQVIGRNIWEIFPGLEESEIGAAYKRAMHEKLSGPMEAYYDRHQKWYRTWPFPYEDGVAVSFLDITQHKAIEQENVKTKERYEMLFRNSPLPKWIVDLETLRFIDVNMAAIRHYGYSKDEFLSMTARDLHAPEDIPKLEEAMTRPMKPTDRFARHKKKNGTFIDAEVTAIDLVVDNRKVRLSAMVDISEQNRYMKEIRSAKEESEKILLALEHKSAQLETILEQMPMSVVFAEAPSGKLIFSNKQFKKIWGYDFIPSESVEQYRDYIAFHKDGRRYESSEWPLARALRGETVLDEDTIVERGDGTKGIFSLTAAPVRDANGAIVAAVVLSQDVTRQREIEVDLRLAKQAAEAASASKTRFLANMSHEIRTPLSAILGFSDLLKAHITEDDEAKTYIERISRNSHQLSRLIDELLDLSKIEAEKIEIERVEVDVETLVEDVRSSMMLKAQEKSLDLSFSWKSSKAKRVFTDPVRLSQILLNIVGNAVKFTERGSVQVEFETTESKFTARVTDTGIGLNADQQARIFEPFMQADASVTRKYGGTGLGLALSKKLSNLLGGDLTLERSAPGAGSVFLIEVSTGHESQNSKPTKVFTEPENVDQISLKDKTILVVDDSPDNRVIASLFFKKTGAKIVEATNGEEGVKLALSNSFDLVLMDIQMPVLDGYQALTRLKEAGYKTPVVALTAHAFKEEKDRCLNMGFDDYLTKPINRETLIRSANRLIKGSKNKR